MSGEVAAHVGEGEAGVLGHLGGDDAVQGVGRAVEGGAGLGGQAGAVAGLAQVVELRVTHDHDLGIGGVAADVVVQGVQGGRQGGGGLLLGGGDLAQAGALRVEHAVLHHGGEAHVVAAVGEADQTGAGAQRRELAALDVRGGGAGAGLEAERAGVRRLLVQVGVGGSALVTAVQVVAGRTDTCGVRVAEGDIAAGGGAGGGGQGEHGRRGHRDDDRSGHQGREGPHGNLR